MKSFKQVLLVMMTLVSSGICASSGFALEREDLKDMGTLKKIIDLLIEYSVKYSFQVLGGFIILVVGWIIAKFVSRFVDQFLQKHHLDITIRKFLVGTAKLIIMAFAAIIALAKFGIEIAPIIAGLSVVGVGVGLAMQGTLSNYAAGISLIFTKPFKVGDIIEVVHEMGEIVDMTLPRTIMKTVDGTMIYIPNKHIIGEIIHNFSELKRLDIKVGVSYKSDIDKCVQLIKDVVKNDPRIALTPEPKIGVSDFGDSSINLYARVFCKQTDYWDTLFSVNKKILGAFQKNGIDIPFPQRDVHLYQQK
jgi:small conductance mechanosensitive channel